MTHDYLPRTVPELAIYVKGVEKGWDERFETVHTALDEIKETQRRITHLVVSCIIAPIIVGVATAIFLNGKF